MDEQQTAMTLQGMAEVVRDWQVRQGMSQAELLRRFPALGTSRTFVRALKGDCSEIDLERWCRDYQGVIHVLEALESAAVSAEENYDDLSTVAAMRIALVGAMRQQGNSRLVLVQGGSGSGKSTALALLRERFGARRVVLCEATDLWRSGKTATSAMLGDILFALSHPDAPTSGLAKLDKVVEILCRSRVCLAIDEAHHCGPTALNLIKTLVNRTPGEFLLCAMGTLWRRLETSTYEEARQLTQNRLFERIQFESAAREDVQAMLERRLHLGCDAQGAARAVSDAAMNQGGLKFAAKVIREAAALTGDDEAGTDMETICKAITRVLRRS